MDDVLDVGFRKKPVYRHGLKSSLSTGFMLLILDLTSTPFIPYISCCISMLAKRAAILEVWWRFTSILID
jgi:hypothetical protein